MARIDFYHLTRQGLDEVLPVLLEKAYGQGKVVKVKVGTTERVEFLNTLLWTYQETSFLPHGTVKDGAADRQPIWLSDHDDVPNGASLLFLVDGATILPEEAERFERIFMIFDGNNAEALQGARCFWRDMKAVGADLHYWQQDSVGWHEKR
jgi:DNA polymerase-3 subunit chi